MPYKERDLLVRKGEHLSWNELLVAPQVIEPEARQPSLDWIPASMCQMERCRQIDMPPVLLPYPTRRDPEVRSRLLDSLDVFDVGACVMNRLSGSDAPITNEMGEHDHLGVGPVLRLDRTWHPTRDRYPTADRQLIESRP